jgi:adenylate kinase family enzyme
MQTSCPVIGVLLFGPPGSGKGEMGKVLMALHSEYLVTNELLYESAKSLKCVAEGGDSEAIVAAALTEKMNSEGMSPDDQVIEVVTNTLKNIDAGRDIAIDTPRSERQVEVFC